MNDYFVSAYEGHKSLCFVTSEMSDEFLHDLVTLLLNGSYKNIFSGNNDLAMEFLDAVQAIRLRDRAISFGQELFTPEIITYFERNGNGDKVVTI